MVCDSSVAIAFCHPCRPLRTDPCQRRNAKTVIAKIKCTGVGLPSSMHKRPDNTSQPLMSSSLSQSGKKLHRQAS